MIVLFAATSSIYSRNDGTEAGFGVLENAKEGITLNNNSNITHSVNTTNATNTPNSTNATSISPPSQGGLWIHVSSWEEGMSSWRKSFSEMLLVAQGLNATLVLPCVKDGHLHTCEDIPMDERISIGDIYDLGRLHDFQRCMATYEQFRAAAAQSVAHQSKICMHSGTPMWICPRNSSSLKTNITELNQAADAAAAAVNREWNQAADADADSDAAVVNATTSRPQGISILEVTDLRKGSFANVQYNGKKLFSNLQQQVESITKQLEFRQEHYGRVDRFLARMNLTHDAPYAAIQWRAEIEGMDYHKCALAIARSRELMMNTSGSLAPKRNFVLISALTLNEELLWGSAKSKMLDHPEVANASSSALKLLRDEGFHKLDMDTALMGELGSIHEQIFLAVWDLILSQRADSFASCDGCPKSRVCTQCNFMGNTIRHALELRKRVNKTSFNCWPE